MYENCLKNSKLTHKELEKQDSFSQFFNIVPLNIDTLGPMMIKHCNLFMREGSTLVLQKFLHSIYDLIVVPKMTTAQVGWLVGFYGISTLVSYLMPNPFLYT